MGTTKLSGWASNIAHPLNFCATVLHTTADTTGGCCMHKKQKSGATRAQRSVIAKILRGGASFLGQILPTQPCKKCGASSWYSDIERLTWYCPICGNRIYYTYGVLRQQIEIICQSQRGREFVRTEDGRCLVPKKNELIKKIKLDSALKDKLQDKKFRRAQRRLRGDNIDDDDSQD